MVLIQIYFLGFFFNKGDIGKHVKLKAGSDTEKKLKRIHGNYPIEYGSVSIAFSFVF